MCEQAHNEKELKLVADSISFLIAKATEGKVTTYRELADHLGIGAPGNVLGSLLSPLLETIQLWASERRLPPLTSIVVRTSGDHKEIPGETFWKVAGLNGIPKRARYVLAERMKRDTFNFYKVF